MAQDCIEHYPYCPRVRSMARRKLRTPGYSLEQHLLAAPSMSDDDLFNIVLLNYAIYSSLVVLSGLRHTPDEEEVADILEHR